MDLLRAADLELIVTGVAVGGLGATLAATRPRLAGVAAAGAAGLALVAAGGRNDLPRVTDSQGNVWLIGLLASGGAIVAVLTCLREHPTLLRHLPAAALLAAIAAWTAVPETSVVLVVGGVGASFTALALVRGSPSGAGAGAVLAVAVAAAAVASSHPDAVRRAGAAACLGLVLWWPLGRGVRAAVVRQRSLAGIAPGGWLVVPHVALALLAARWVSVAPDATWWRLALIGGVGVLISALVRPSATMDP